MLYIYIHTIKYQALWYQYTIITHIFWHRCHSQGGWHYWLEIFHISILTHHNQGGWYTDMQIFCTDVTIRVDGIIDMQSFHTSFMTKISWWLMIYKNETQFNNQGHNPFCNNGHYADTHYIIFFIIIYTSMPFCSQSLCKVAVVAHICKSPWEGECYAELC